MKSLIIITIFVVLIFLEVKTLIKSNKIGEALVVIVMYSIGFTLNLLLIKDVKIPNPTKTIESLVNMLLAFLRF